MDDIKESFRGVVVYTAPKGEIHQHIGFYTEFGMVYTTVYGARKSKNLNKRMLAPFVMGRVYVEKNKNNILNFKDIEVYRNGDSLSRGLPLYYTAYLCIELVRLFFGADHKFQFKLLVDILLYLIEENTMLWKETLVLFLWQSLSYHGWQPNLPDISHDSQDHNKWVLYYTGEVKILDTLYSEYQESSLYSGDTVKGIDYFIIDPHLMILLKTVIYHPIKKTIPVFSSLSSDILSSFISFLIQCWQHILGKNLKTVDYIQNFL